MDFQIFCGFANDTVTIDYKETVIKTTRPASVGNKPFPVKKTVETCSHGDDCNIGYKDCPATYEVLKQ
ncbi:hypothetical protein [Acetobacterium wieringae]|uniref:hypothetical protein n=1 Tax=Acetobacterium wieringae TaxID=52694 RepID=UPI002033B143|nr:hypothetical protein [Acetobacterium wieringae]URN84006.1 hypothetical protein CHL1_003174 [Acetobacterium wieringae]